MSGILIYADKTDITKQLMTACLSLKETINQPVYVIVTGEEDLEQFITIGADKIFALKGSNPWVESYANAIADLAISEQVNVILFGGTLRCKNIAAYVAARMEAGLVSEAQTLKFVNGALETTRLLYGGLAVATDIVTLPALVTIAPKTFAEAETIDKKAEVLTKVVQNTDSQILIGEVNPIVKEGVEISEASKIVSVGRGLSKQEDLKMVESLAAFLDAEIACSRGIAEDYRWLPVERYIGISGQKVKPDLYFSLGISGQVQHLAGMRDSKVIVAVDTNENAPIFGAADYGIVGDIYEIVPLLIEALK